MPLLLLGVILFGVGIGNATSLPPLIAQTEFVKDDVPRVVALIVGIAQGTFAFAPAAFGLIREFAPQPTPGSAWRLRCRGLAAGIGDCRLSARSPAPVSLSAAAGYSGYSGMTCVLSRCALTRRLIRSSSTVTRSFSSSDRMVATRPSQDAGNHLNLLANLVWNGRPHDGAVDLAGPQGMDQARIHQARLVATPDQRPHPVGGQDRAPAVLLGPDIDEQVAGKQRPQHLLHTPRV